MKKLISKYALFAKIIGISISLQMLPHKLNIFSLFLLLYQLEMNLFRFTNAMGFTAT